MSASIVVPAPVSSRSLATLKTFFGAVCDEVRVEGDEPLLLDDPQYAYFTQIAQHQLFCVESRDGRAAGRREHVASLASGQLLLGRAPGADDPTVLLVSGPAGSQVLRVPVKLLIEALSKEDDVAQRLFDGWIELLIAILPKAPVPTRCEPVQPGATLGSVAGALRASAGVLWLALADSPIRYGGVNANELAGAGPVLWPLTPTMWILGSGGAPLSTRDGTAAPGSRTARTDWATGAKAMKSTDALASMRSTRFVEEFHGFVIGVVAKNRKAVERRRLDLDTQSREAEREFVEGSLRRLAHVGEAEALDDGAGDALERAGARIAKFLDVADLRLRSPVLKKGERASLGKIQTALSLITSVRTRRVLLEGRWHTHDGGALLGFLLDDGDDIQDERVNPVALLPAGRGYELHDPRKPAPVPVDAAIVARLHPQAYQFYPSLPDRPLRPIDILRFSGSRSLRDIAFVLVIGLGLGSLSTLIPLMTGQVFDQLIPGAQRGLLLQLSLVLALVYFGQALFNVARNLAIVRFETRMDARLEAGVWDRLLNLPLPFFRNYSAGDLSSRAAGIGYIRQILVGTTLGALLGGLFSIWSFGLLFVIDPALAGVATLLVIGAIIPALLGSYYGLRRQRTVAAIDGKIDGLLLQLLSGIAKLRVTAAENRAFAVWAKLFARRRDAEVSSERINVRISLVQTVYPVVCSMMLYWMLAGGDKQRVSTGMFLAFTAAFGGFLGSTLHLIDALLQSLAVIPLFERAKPILEARAENQGSGERVDLKGEIEVNHVSFRYHPEGPLILDDVSFHVHPDEFVALVGPSGSGKSTLLRLLLGFDNCTEGGVFYDGLALSGLDVRAVRKQIGVVMQNSRVLGGDIFTNIVGNTGRTQEDAWQAARNAALDKDIEAMPMGMHTVISQGGGTLSGGQRQRLLIARALATDPKLVFFDEATSALDNLTQATVSEGLANLRVSRVVIAHRLSTIRHADRIIVLEKGRVVQSGRFEELVNVPGPFKTLAERQMV